MSHTSDFEEFRAKREAARRAEVRVTWRKVSADTGGGWSGIGPNGRLVFVNEKRPSGYEYGRRAGKVKTVAGVGATLPRAKRAAEALMKADCQ